MFATGVRRALGLHLAVVLAFSALSALILWPITGGDYPPGVDTPAFLHLSWVADLALSGGLSDPSQDPFWYGGFFYLVYPPLSYGLVGVLSSITPAHFVDIYLALLILSHGLLAYSVWFLAREFGLRWWAAVVAGLFSVAAYPSLSAVFLWGWFTTLMALPFALVSFALLERSISRHSWRSAVGAGVLMALSTYAHHMTSAAVTMGLVFWFAYLLSAGRVPRWELLRRSLTAAVTTVVLVLPWAVPFLINASDAGFRREIPGNWLAPLSTFGSNLLDPSLVGVFTYPSYLGIVLTTLALIGGAVALIETRRLAGVVLLLAGLVWFSLGANGNPLINHYPFSGLDVGRFHLFMTPFMALLAAFALERLTGPLTRSAHLLVPSLAGSPLVWRSVAVAALVLVLAYPAYNAWRARSLAEPYRVEAPVAQAMEWLADAPRDDSGAPPGVFGTGFWNWHAFLVPNLAGQRVIDGWHDEGANNVEQIRRLRRMAWIGGEPVDAEAAHEILTGLGTDYVLLHRTYWLGERACEYWARMEENPALFQLAAEWGDVGVFRVLSPSE